MFSKTACCAALFCLNSLCIFPSQMELLHAAQPAAGQVIQAVDETARTPLAGNTHPMARAEFDRGEAPADLALERMILVLKRPPAREAALLRRLEDQQDKTSAAYHKWLTPQQVGAEFGPAASDIAVVTQWLQSNGFRVSRVSASGVFIEFSGTAGLVKQAFAASIHKFVIDGETHWANAANPSIPTALAPVVAGVESLNNFRRQAQHSYAGAYSSQTKRLLSPAPEDTFLDNSNTVYALAPYDFAAIYDLLPLWTAAPTHIDGTGQTIAIAGRSDINPQDATTFWNEFGLDGTHAPRPTLVITYNGPNPGFNGDESEADIDTQWSGAVAPGATIDFVTSQSTETTDGVDLSALYIVENNLAPVMSVSYGECEKSLGSAGVQFYGSLWEQAAAQGISVFVSTGDNGAAGCDSRTAPAKHGLQVNGLASTPFNAAVGGTDFNQYQAWTTYWNSTNAAVTSQSAKGYIPETTWNDSCTNSLLQYLQGGSTNAYYNCNNSAFQSFLKSSGGSGGVSSSWPKPDWQTGTPSDNARDLPDVSLFASNGFLGSFYIVCESDVATLDCASGRLSGFGGTSVSAPAFAGIMALVNQKTGSAQGIPGLTFYKLASQVPSAFHDVPSGSTIAMPCTTGTPNCVSKNATDNYGVLSGYSTGAGYDLATGLGSVDAANLVNQWSSISFSPSSTALTLNSGSAVKIAHGTSVPVSVAVSPAAATGEVALLVSPIKPGNPGFAVFPLSSGGAAGSTAALPGGTYNVVAHYAGDANYGGSYSNVVPVQVTPEASKVLVKLVTTTVKGKPTSFAATSATYGDGSQRLRIDVGDAHATVTPASGISSACSQRTSSCPTGKVTLSAPGTALDGMALALNSEGYAEVLSIVPGTYNIVASYSGDSSYNSSAGTGSFTIAKAPTTATAAYSGTPVQYGDPEQIDGAIATQSYGAAPGGSFQFIVDGVLAGQPVTTIESFPYNPGVTPSQYALADASTLYSFTKLGNHTLAVQYSGDANYAASTSPAITVPVSQAAGYFNSIGAIPNPVSIGQATTLSATFFGSFEGVAPTGTVRFFSNGAALGGTVTYTPSTIGAGSLTATMPVVFNAQGTFQITATYSGDANYTGINSSIADSLTVTGPITLTPAGTVTVSAPGMSGSTAISVVSGDGFTGAVSLSCTPDPKANEATCSLGSGTSTGTTVQINLGKSASSVNLTVNTTASHTVAAGASPTLAGSARIALAGILIFCAPLFRRRRLLFCLLAIVMACGIGACGGGGKSSVTDPGTAAGSYTFTVSATSGTGASAATTSTAVAVTVQ